MKYLVTWQTAGEPSEWASSCRFYNERNEAYEDYKLFKDNHNFGNVHFIQINEKDDNERN